MCKPTYEQLAEQVRLLTEQRDAVVAGLSGRKFFMYSDDSGFEIFETREEAIKAAQEMIDECREDAYDGWPEEADTIRWGVVIQQAQETDFKKPAPENGWEGSSDYKLLPETPATDAIRNSLRAEAKGEVLDEMAATYRGWASEDDCSCNMKSSYNLTAERAENYAAYVRRQLLESKGEVSNG